MPYFTNAQQFIDGQVIILNKPYEWTSFNLVRKVQFVLNKYLNIKKIKTGHAGTLDPLATGLMIICTGKATKKIQAFQELDKEYLATFKLGATTPSFDLETPIDKEYDTNHITSTMIEKSLQQFTGIINQVPPVYSAVNISGKRAYEYARKGKKIKLDAKKIEIKHIDIEHIRIPDVKIRILCSKGTYIRSLVRDIGHSLKSGAHLIALQRTAVGDYTLANALTVDEFEMQIKMLSNKN
jgi:tRNA pseudouridine55 synthase